MRATSPVNYFFLILAKCSVICIDYLCSSVHHSQEDYASYGTTGGSGVHTFFDN